MSCGLSAASLDAPAGALVHSCRCCRCDFYHISRFDVGLKVPRCHEVWAGLLNVISPISIRNPSSRQRWLGPWGRRVCGGGEVGGVNRVVLWVGVTSDVAGGFWIGGSSPSSGLFFLVFSRVFLGKALL
jgi:hypothetical protein